MSFLRRIKRKGLIKTRVEVALARRRYPYIVEPTSVRETTRRLREGGQG